MMGIRHCAIATAALGLTAAAPATVIQYQPHEEQRAVIMDDTGIFTDQLGFWSETITDGGSQYASQTSVLGPKIVGSWQAASGPDAASHFNIYFTVTNDVSFNLSAAATGGGLVLVLRDATAGTFPVLFTTFAEDSLTYTGELLAGHEYSLLSTLVDPFGTSPEAAVVFSLQDGNISGPTPLPAPGMAGLMGAAGLVVGVRRRRAAA